MANLKSANKRIRTNEHKRQVNKSQKNKVRTALKKARNAVDEGSEDAEPLVKDAVQKLDRAATRGLISKNKAARNKSQLQRGLNNLE